MNTARGILLSLMFAATVAIADDAIHENLGQSFAHPLSRFDIRVKYVDLSDGAAANVLTARLDRPFKLASGWKLNTRINMTGVVSDPRGSDNPDGAWHAATGDLFTQLFLIAPQIGKTSIGFGSRFYFPAAGEDQLGKGKYRVAPLIVALHFPGWLPTGSFYGLGVRNEFSYAGDRARRGISELQIVPVLNIALPERSFVSFFEEIRHDWKSAGNWFVPFDVEYGRKFAPDRAASLRLQIPVVNDLDLYDWTLEARLSFFF
jgi:hypothetical protein